MDSPSISVKELVKAGKMYLDSQNYDDALSSFEQALTLESKNPDLWNLKGITLRSMGRYDEASDCYNKSLELEPRDKVSS